MGTIRIVATLAILLGACGGEDAPVYVGVWNVSVECMTIMGPVTDVEPCTFVEAEVLHTEGYRVVLWSLGHLWVLESQETEPGELTVPDGQIEGLYNFVLTWSSDGETFTGGGHYQGIDSTIDFTVEGTRR